MAANDEVLGELIKAKENIKRKYTALKQGKADIHSLVTETLNPIIEPLNKLKHFTSSQAPVIELTKDKEIQNSDVSQNIQINDVLDSFNIDKTYGPKIQSDNTVYLGKKEIKLIDNTLIVEDTSYPMTSGLGNLIFSKTPKIYTKSDLKTYKSILVQTSAHLTADGKKIKKGGKKYTIIRHLFPSGSGLSVKLQKHNLVYWDNPNELVDRLRLLLASKAAGNTGVSNEILSIFEELREAGLINRIPNV